MYLTTLDSQRDMVYSKLSKQAVTTARKEHTMNIQILNSNKTENGLYVNVMANKKEVAIYIPDNAHYTVNVLVKNASHSANSARAMRSTGKDFTTWEDAMNNYKSLEVQGAIMTAYELTQYNNPKVLN